MEDGLRIIEAGACGAWQLPGDPTCAGIARRVYRRVVDGLSLDPALVDDGVAIVSELAANTLHIRKEEQETSPELWLYLRGGGSKRELVCKVFDSYPGWLTGEPYGGSVCGHASRVPPDAMSGRGLEVVHELSGGRWGYHLTRSRLDGGHARGKAVWFAVPVPEPAKPARPAGAAPPVTAHTIDAARTVYTVHAGYTVHAARAPEGPGLPVTAKAAMTEVESGLAARGLRDTLVRADDAAADMAVLSVCSGITVWCRAGAAWLRAPGMSGDQWGYGDLVEVVELAVEAHETMADREEVRELAAASPTGA